MIGTALSGAVFCCRLHEMHKAANVSDDPPLPLARSAKAANVSGDPPWFFLTLQILCAIMGKTAQEVHYAA